eukprot:scaffold18684_cov121-Isochrysis_galbana.AAC.8
MTLQSQRSCSAREMAAAVSASPQARLTARPAEVFRRAAGRRQSEHVRCSHAAAPTRRCV